MHTLIITLLTESAVDHAITFSVPYSQEKHVVAIVEDKV
jgi:hypothetical protein